MKEGTSKYSTIQRLKWICSYIKSYLREYSTGRLSFLSTRDLKSKLAIHISALPISTIDKRNSGEIVSIYSNEAVDLQRFIKDANFKMQNTKQLENQIVLLTMLSLE